MADKEKVEEVVEEVVEEKPKKVVDEKPLIGVLLEDNGGEYYWTEKSGMDKPIKVYTGN